MRPYYRKKGKYNDGRVRIMIERIENNKIKQKALPKPEVLWEILDRGRLPIISKEKEGQVNACTKFPLSSDKASLPAKAKYRTGKLRK